MEFNSNVSCLIEKNTRKNKKKVMLNINSRFRDNYYKTDSGDYQITLPYTLSNIVNISLNSFECSTRLYTISEKLKTNEFTIETYQYDLFKNAQSIKEENRTAGPMEIKSHVIKIKDGLYTGAELERYLNVNVFSAPNSGVSRYRNININKLHERVNPDIWSDDYKNPNKKGVDNKRMLSQDVINAFQNTIDAEDPAVEANPTLDLAAILAQQNAINDELLSLGDNFTANQGQMFNALRDDNSQLELKRILCKYDEPSGKFYFFRDTRELIKGGLPDTDAVAYKFNISWKLKDDPDRPIQLNLGWILGFRKQYYNIDDYVFRQDITSNKFEGYNAECQYKPGVGYVFLSLNDYNKSVGETILSPFQESSYADGDILDKLYVEDGIIKFKENRVNYIVRQYYGPINLKKIKIRLLDEFGRTVDLNNSDYSFSIMLEQLYD